MSQAASSSAQPFTNPDGSTRAVRPMAAGIEGAARRDREVVAGGQDVADVQAAVALDQFAPGKSADLAARLVGAEAGVDVAQLGDDGVEDLGRDERFVDVDRDDRAHDRLDPSLGRRVELGRHVRPDVHQ